MKQAQRILAVLLSLLMLSATCAMYGSVAAAGEDDVTVIGSGPCGAEGSEVEYTLYSDGRLVISGRGVIDGDFFSNENSPLVKNVIINEGITELAPNAFRYMSLESIVFPDSLRKIGQLAFWDCWSLTDVTFGANLEIISNDAFPFCTHLETMILPDSVTELGQQAFYGCERLKKVQIPAGVASIGSKTFCDCRRLEQLIVLNGNAAMDDACLTELQGAVPTIYSYAGGSVEAFANEKGFPFIALDADGHAWDVGTVTTPATCEAAGVKTFSCVLCSATKPEPIPATGHTWGEWQTVREATIFRKGEEARVCGNDAAHRETRKTDRLSSPLKPLLDFFDWLLGRD